MQIYRLLKFETCLFAMLVKEKVACGLSLIGHGPKKNLGHTNLLENTHNNFSPIPWPADKTIGGLFQTDVTELTQYAGG